MYEEKRGERGVSKKTGGPKMLGYRYVTFLINIYRRSLIFLSGSRSGSVLMVLCEPYGGSVHHSTGCQIVLLSTHGVHEVYLASSIRCLC